jgi:hypothetical protein
MSTRQLYDYKGQHFFSETCSRLVATTPLEKKSVLSCLEATWPFGFCDDRCINSGSYTLYKAIFTGIKGNRLLQR